jgi:hypothetical protein
MTIMGRILVALYQDTATAHHVVASLLEAGFSIDDVSLLVKDESAFYGKSGVHNGEFALLGALVGMAVSIGTAFVPGIGPIMGQDALGILATAGVGAAAGALTGGISAELIDVDEDDPIPFQSGTIVSLTTNDQWLEWGERIMGRYHPLKIEEREANWYGSSLGKFDLEHASSRAMKIIQDRSSATMQQIKSGTTLQKRARSYKYPN